MGCDKPTPQELAELCDAMDEAKKYLVLTSLLPERPESYIPTKEQVLKNMSQSLDRYLEENPPDEADD